ncbi:unnamed protein product [Rangifer tarandus platyrhynchus]|uniref:Uncharacterized protein n=1 Tax=Rangifer tarandus platyrhynchus TaxID=3082113 RepID=A0AC59Y756_RANTA
MARLPMRTHKGALYAAVGPLTCGGESGSSPARSISAAAPRRRSPRPRAAGPGHTRLRPQGLSGCGSPEAPSLPRGPVVRTYMETSCTDVVDVDTSQMHGDTDGQEVQRSARPVCRMADQPGPTVCSPEAELGAPGAGLGPRRLGLGGQGDAALLPVSPGPQEVVIRPTSVRPPGLHPGETVLSTDGSTPHVASERRITSSSLGHSPGARGDGGRTQDHCGRRPPLGGGDEVCSPLACPPSLCLRPSPPSLVGPQSLLWARGWGRWGGGLLRGGPERRLHLGQGRSGPGPHTADLKDGWGSYPGVCTEGAVAADGGSESRRPWAPPPRLWEGLPAGQAEEDRRLQTSFTRNLLASGAVTAAQGWPGCPLQAVIRAQQGPAAEHPDAHNASRRVCHFSPQVPPNHCRLAVSAV